jgi:hypothetical protein
MGRLKFLNIRAVVDNDRMAMSRRKGHDGANWTPRKRTSRVVVETIRLVDIPRDRGELNDQRTSRGRRDSGGRGVDLDGLDRIRAYAVRVTAIQMMIARMDTE